MSDFDIEKLLLGVDGKGAVASGGAGDGGDNADDAEQFDLSGLDAMFGTQGLGLSAEDLKRSGGEAVKANEDAIDFEDFDELAEEEDDAEVKDSEQNSEGGGNGVLDGEHGAGDGENDDENDDLFAERSKDAGDVVTASDNDTSALQNDLLSADLFDVFGGPLEEMAEALPETSEELQEIPDAAEETVRAPLTRSSMAVSMDPAQRQQLAKSLFPDFESDKPLKMSKLFAPKSAMLAPFRRKITKACIPTRVALENEVDELAYFRSRRPLPRRQRHTTRVDKTQFEHGILRVGSDKAAEESVDDGVTMTEEGSFLGMLTTRDLNLTAFEWEKGIKWDEHTVDDSYMHQNSEDMRQVKRLKLQDPIYDDSVLVAGKVGNTHVVLDMNDSHLLLQKMDSEPSLRYAKNNNGSSTRWKFDVSNDKEYSMLREPKLSKGRQNLSELSVEHAPFAVRLQIPLFKTRISKKEARTFHRTPMSFRPDVLIRFTRLRKVGKSERKMAAHDINKALATSDTIGLSDTSDFYLFEYSEEQPPILSNVGMGSRIINYYRKKDDQDDTRPKLPHGEVQVLSALDQSPFWNFGFVRPGETVPALYNKLYRAPIFHHAEQQTDFLLIRSTDNNGSRYALRNIKNLFLVGQTLPSVDVPGPHSRRATTTSKNRLKMVVFRLLRRQGNIGLSIKEIARHFADQNEMQIRQRLKEFMEYQKPGPDEQGTWRLRPTEPLLDEEGTRALVSPEMACLLDSMQVGLRALEDAGYAKADEEDATDRGGDDDESLSMEQKIAPWITTRNFVNATQGKAMLELHGEGDPTGIGEGISFIRTSMKGGYRPRNGESLDQFQPNVKESASAKEKEKAHNYNIARQQMAYNSEIERIWNAQAKSLASKEPRKPPHVRSGAMSRSVSETPSIGSDMHFDDRASSVDPSDRNVLRITRTFKTLSGRIEQKTETIRDPHVIHAYVKRRQQAEESSMSADMLVPTNDEERNRRVKRNIEAMLAKLEKARERRQIRKAQKAAGLLNKKPHQEEIDPSNPDALLQGKLGGTQRRCGNCGQPGHMRTWKHCPMYGKLEAGLREAADRSQRESTEMSGRGSVEPAGGRIPYALDDNDDYAMSASASPRGFGPDATASFSPA